MRLYFRGIMENYPGLLKVASASLGEKLPPKLQLTASPPAWGGGLFLRKPGQEQGISGSFWGLHLSGRFPTCFSRGPAPRASGSASVVLHSAQAQGKKRSPSSRGSGGGVRLSPGRRRCCRLVRCLAPSFCADQEPLGSPQAWGRWDSAPCPRQA